MLVPKSSTGQYITTGVDNDLCYMVAKSLSIPMMAMFKDLAYASLGQQQ